MVAGWVWEVPASLATRSQAGLSVPDPRNTKTPYSTSLQEERSRELAVLWRKPSEKGLFVLWLSLRLVSRSGWQEATTLGAPYSAVAWGKAHPAFLKLVPSQRAKPGNT